MTSCARYAPMLGARPGELSDEDARGLGEHLGACATCQARLADVDAMAGLLSEGLMAEANRRDFSTFSDGVLERIPQYRRAAGRPGLWSWVRHHRLVTAVGTLAPALAALAVVVYVGRGQVAPDDVLVQVVSESGSATVLDTSDGPVVLLGEDDPAGT